jgi:hypothetical protein
MGKGREPEIILKTEERTGILNLGRDGKFQARSGCWGDRRVFPRRRRMEVQVVRGRRVVTTSPESRMRRRCLSSITSRPSE